MERRPSKLTAAERASLLAAISNLPELQASLIVLHYLHDHPLIEVAEKLELSPMEVSIQHHAALVAMRRFNDKFDGV